MSKTDADSEITITHTFKSNNMVAENDLVLMFQLREILARSAVDANEKYLILRNEARRLRKDTLGFEDEVAKL